MEIYKEYEGGGEKGKAIESEGRESEGGVGEGDGSGEIVCFTCRTLLTVDSMLHIVHIIKQVTGHALNTIIFSALTLTYLINSPDTYAIKSTIFNPCI